MAPWRRTAPLALLALLPAGCLASAKAVPVTGLPGPVAAVAAPAAAPEAPREAWRADVGNGLEYGITVRGPVFFATTTNRVVVAHATADGARFWGRRYGSPLVGAPQVAGRRLYVGTGYRDRKVHALDAELGRAVWERRVGEVRTAPGGGDTLFVPLEDGRLQALLAEDGRTLWERRLGDKAAWAPVVHGGRVLVATYRDTLYALDAGSGAVAARLALGGTPSAPPLLRDGVLYVPVHPGAVVAVRLAAGGPEVAWRAALLDPVLAAPVPAPDGGLAVLDRSARVWRLAENGTARVLAELGGSATGSLAAAAQGVVVGRLDGALFLVDGDGGVRWRMELGDAVVHPVTVTAEGLLVPLLHGHVVRLR